MNQTLSLVEQLRNLERIQEVDLKIDSLKRGQASIPASLKLIDDSLQQLKVKLTTKENQVAEFEKTQRQTLAALELNKDRLSRASSKLESVQNSQEFQAANKEIDQLKKLNLSLEEQNKKLLSDIEQVRQEVKALSEQFEKAQGERNTQAENASGQETQVKGEINTLVNEKSKYLDKVEKRLLAQYERIRTARGGVGLVPAVGGRCKGCNMVVPPQLYNEVYRGSLLHSCPSCNRLLFVPAPPATETEGERA